MGPMDAFLVSVALITGASVSSGWWRVSAYRVIELSRSYVMHSCLALSRYVQSNDTTEWCDFCTA